MGAKKTSYNFIARVLTGMPVCLGVVEAIARVLTGMPVCLGVVEAIARVLTGMPVCLGVVEAIARVVNTLEEASSIEVRTEIFTCV